MKNGNVGKLSGSEKEHKKHTLQNTRYLAEYLMQGITVEDGRVPAGTRTTGKIPATIKDIVD